MNAKTKGQSMFAAILGSAMLLVVLAAALTPNFGTVSAQSSCPYGNCTSGGGSSFPWTELFLGLAVILAALILAMLAIYYRRRKPPAGDDSNVSGGVGSTGGDTTPRLTPERPRLQPPPKPFLPTSKLRNSSERLPGYLAKRGQARRRSGQGRRTTRQEAAVLKLISTPCWPRSTRSATRL